MFDFDQPSCSCYIYNQHNTILVRSFYPKFLANLMEYYILELNQYILHDQHNSNSCTIDRNQTHQLHKHHLVS